SRVVRAKSGAMARTALPCSAPPAAADFLCMRLAKMTMPITTTMTTIRTRLLRFTTDPLQRETIEEREIARKHGQTMREHQDADHDQQHTADDFHRVQMTAKPRVER